MIQTRTLSFELLPKMLRRISKPKTSSLRMSEERPQKGFLADFERMLSTGIEPLLRERQED